MHEEERLSLLAVEHGLTRAQLHKTAGPGERARDVDAWLEAHLGNETIEARTIVGMKAWDGSGPRFTLRGDLAQGRVRALARAGELERVVADGRQRFGARAMGGATLLLQQGNLAAFDRWVAHHAKRMPVTAEVWLRSSLCDGFDPDWLMRRYGDDAPAVVARVLVEALRRPAPCDALYRWACEQTLPGTETALGQHAISRGDPALARRLTGHASERVAAAFEASACYLQGDLVATNAALARVVAGRKKPPDCGYVAPLLAIVLLEHDTERMTARARNLVNAAVVEPGVVKAFRALLRHHERDEGDASTLHVRQLPVDVGAWHLLLTGFIAHQRVERAGTRGAWAQALVREGQAWAEHGYPWLGRQALLLAGELMPEVDGAAQPEARELSPWQRLTPKPAWQKALAVLTQVSGSIAQEAQAPRRVAWVVDVPTASMRRPWLQSVDATGSWSSGERVPMSALTALVESLPPEDRDVVRRLRGHGGELEALEALIGHPRVFDGARGMTPVVVVRGRCRVETRDVLGGIAVAVEPRGAKAGLHAVAEGADRVAVYRVEAAFERLARALPEGLFVPQEGEKELLEVLAKLASGVEVVGPHLAEEEPVVANPTPCVRVAVKAGAYVVQVGVRPFGDGGRFQAAGKGVARLRRIVKSRRQWCERDLEREREERAALLASCPSLSPPEEGEELWTFDEVGLLCVLSELSRTELAHVLEWRGAKGLLLAGTVTQHNLRGRLRSIKRWYVAEGTARLDAETEKSLAQLSGLPSLADGRFLRIAPGEYVEVETRLLGAMAALRTAARDGAGVRLHAGALPSMQALIDGPLETDVAAVEWVQRYAASRDKRYRVPRALNATLRDYQVEGYRWLRRMCDAGIGACLADDMGLGKTVQVIALLLARSRNGPALVVAPTSVCSNWMRELSRFAPELEVTDHSGPGRAAELDVGPGMVVVVSYAVMQQDVEALEKVNWEVVTLDEAQLIKNPATLRARAAYRLKAQCRVAATGTPIENDVGDLWAIFRFLNPGLLGSWKTFRRTFLLAIERDGSIEARERLRKLVGGYILRRLKRDVLQSLPPLTEVVLDIELDQAESALHQLLQRDVRDMLEQARGRRGHELEILAAITKLRRFCCHPRLVYPDVEVGSSKVEALITLVEELRENGHRALVFSQFVGLLDLVRERLHECGISFAYLDGSTPRAVRQKRVDAFQEGEATLFLISLKAGGFGLNLTGADYVVHLDPWWNPAVEAQATDRAHRMGQTRPVTVYRLVTRGTIEEKIVALQESKRELADAILDGGEAPDLSPAEWLGLL